MVSKRRKKQCTVVRGLVGGEREGKREGGEIALLYQLCPQIQIPNVLIPKRIRELKPNPLVFAQICLKRTEILFFENVKERPSSEEGRLCRARAEVSGATSTEPKSQMLTLHPKSMTEK